MNSASCTRYEKPTHVVLDLDPSEGANILTVLRLPSFRTIGHTIATKRSSKHGQLRRVMSRSRVVIGVIGDDIHIVGNRIMQLAMEECGFSVHNLRTRNRPERFVHAAAVPSSALRFA
jgi:hypothetical protein